jgi:hypothetical protein
VNTVTVEIVGYRDSECSPFPCDEDRSCGFTACFPSGRLIPAVEALRSKLSDEFSHQVSVQLTLLDDGVPDYIREIYEAEHPAIPMVLINKRIVPVGRISWEQIREEVARALKP